MSRAAAEVIAAFEGLPPTDREEVVSELLRRVAQSAHQAPSDEELTTAADQVFQAIDRAETPGRRGPQPGTKCGSSISAWPRRSVPRS